MRRRALEIQAVAGLQKIMLAVAQPNFKSAAKDMQEFLAFVCVGFAAAAPGFHAKQMRLHRGVAPGEKLHADAGVGLQNLSLRGTYQAGILSGSLEQRKDIGAIEARDAAECSHRRAHLATLQRAEKADGDARGARHLRERKSAAGAQAAKALAGKRGGFGGERDGALPLEHVDDGRRIQAASAAEKQRT